MPRAAKKSLKIEQDGIRLRIFLNGETWWVDYRHDDQRERFSLKTMLRSTAEASAREYASQVARQRMLGVRLDRLTLGEVFDWYRRAVLTKLNKKGQPVTRGFRKQADLRMALFEQQWGRRKLVADIGQPDVDAFITARRAGTLTSLEPVEAKKGRKAVAVRLGTIDSDMRWLKSAFNYATKHTVNGKAFLDQNPLDRVTWPRENERNKLRPRATAERYELTQEHTDTVDPSGRLRCTLALARHTGHRENSILHLRVSDMLLTEAAVKAALRLVGRDEAEAEYFPSGGIFWRGEHDKMGANHLSALNPAARAEVDRYLQKSRRIGDAWLLPGIEDPSKPLGNRVASRQLLRAETLAKLDKLKGGIWHPYRRAWATDRKSFSDIDVASAGGWSGTRALKLSYQQSDPASMLAVVNHGS